MRRVGYYDLRPLDQIRSIKAKLGILVAVSIAAAAVVAVVGTRSGVSGWVIVVLAVGVGLAVTQVLAHGMTSPLREMTQAAQRMAQGDYSRRVRASSRDEIGELARAFNRMSATLEQVDRHRRDLVANVSHELRTPISALQAVLENLADGVSQPGPDELRSALAQTERLGRLVSDLLDLSRVEDGVTPLHVKDLDLENFLTEAVAQARVDGLRYSIAVDPAGLTVPADPDRLHQLLANLLDNAAKHSPADGHVRVTARRSPDPSALHPHSGPVAGTHVDARAGSVVLAVTDDGPGIPEADRVAVFERFTTSAAHSSGTGLGLAISRWVAQLHGGSIAVADSDRGCRIEVRLPTGTTRPMATKEPVMSTLTPPAPLPPAAAPHNPLGNLWPDASVRRPGVVAAAAAAGVVAATVLPDRNVGLGTALVFGLVCAVVLGARTARGGRRWTPLDAADAGLATLLLATLVLRDAAWITILCLLAALALVAVNSTRAASVLAVVGTAVAVPVAAIRGLPWLGRTLRPSEKVRSWLPAIRATLVSIVLVIVFGALFASADALFAAWVDAVTPDVTWNDLPARAVLAVFAAGGTLAAAFVSIAPPDVSRLALPTRRSRKTFEWLAPVSVVNAVFLLFLVAQATALFGGHDYLQRTTGLTYADYVHEGFGQLTVATILTLAVVAWAARRAEPGRARDAALGALCAMTVVVVLSALHRMSLYEQAYGFTRLRLLVSVFEAWLGVVVLLVLAAGVLRRGGWLVPAAVRLGAVGLLGLALVNPDLYIAEHNIARTNAAAGTDLAYLGGLSADAYPALAELPDAEFACATQSTQRPRDDDWLEWNLGREQARDLIADRPPSTSDSTAPCPISR